jgi:hypothetical protein
MVEQEKSISRYKKICVHVLTLTNYSKIKLMEDNSNHQNKLIISSTEITHLFHVQDATITMLRFLSFCPGHC